VASRKEQKEQLRQQRLEAEAHERRSQQRQRILGLGVAAVLTAAVVAGIVAVILASGGEDEADTAAHIVSRTGMTEGLQPDERTGTPPAPIADARLAKAAKAAKCKLREDLPDEGRTHLLPTEETPKYGTNPPTSGNHDPTPIADGAYLTMPQPRNFVHSLEHGRIEIQYASSLPPADQLALKGIFDEDFVHMLMFPNDDMKAEVAVTAWRNLMTCEKYSPKVLDAIRDFRDAHRDQGPETVA
jgi:hypothetical protein